MRKTTERIPLLLGSSTIASIPNTIWTHIPKTTIAILSLDQGEMDSEEHGWGELWPVLQRLSLYRCTWVRKSNDVPFLTTEPVKKWVLLTNKGKTLAATIRLFEQVNEWKQWVSTHQSDELTCSKSNKFTGVESRVRWKLYRNMSLLIW